MSPTNSDDTNILGVQHAATESFSLESVAFMLANGGGMRAWIVWVDLNVRPLFLTVDLLLVLLYKSRDALKEAHCHPQ